MKVTSGIILLLVLCFSLSGQTISDQQAKALNNYIALVNHLNKELSGQGTALESVVSNIKNFRKYNGKRPVSHYTSGIDTEPYYFEEAEKTAGSLGSKGTTITQKVKKLTTTFREIDKTSKEIEIYYRLKDYEKDNFRKIEELLPVIITQIHQYKREVDDFDKEAERLYYSLQPYSASDPYQKTEKLMRDQLAFEKTLLDEWTFNISTANYTGWPNKVMEKHILNAEEKIAELNKYTDRVKYPASSQYKSFISSVESLQNTKRHGIDGNTYESQQSDDFSNTLYKNLINYYDNAAISFYNNFNKMALQNGFRGLNYVTYVFQFDLREESKPINTTVTPFTDLPYSTVNVSPTTAAISPAIQASLSAYMEYINESVRQINNLTRAIYNLNSDAARGKGRQKAGEKVYINYYKNNFEPPVSLFQSAVSQTKNLPAGTQKSLKDQAETLQSILTEINQWNTVLLTDAAKKELDKDSLNHVYSILMRYKVLTEAFDIRKERLYNDVRQIYASYKPTNPKSSWVVSGNTLLKLTDEDHAALYSAKKFLMKETSTKPSTTTINSLARETIVNEFTNLEGIKKLGRYNGNCPYSPYEDLAKYSIQFAEFIDQSDPDKTDSYHRHPYNKLVSGYNSTVAHYYNKFVELSVAPLLKTATQIELFELIDPIPYTPRVYAQNTTEKEVKDPQPTNAVVPAAGTVIRDTVRVTDVIRIETIRQDTVYINRVDTVYMGTLDEDALSMEGYATNNMVLLLDVSGSMNNPDKLPLLKKSVLLLLKTMRQEDQISIITYSGKARVALQPTSFKDEEKIKRVIEQLKSEGKTDGNAGLKLAYDVVEKN